MKKIAAAHRLLKPVDGHAPGLRGDDAKKYIAAGISTDHECFTAEEALDKLQWGMKILIREGSAARNFEALVDLLNDHSDNMMFCSDDKHPDSLLIGHINQLCARAVAKGIDVFKVLRAACINPVEHYKLDVGQLKVGDPADFIIAEDLVNFNIHQTYINGELVAEKGKSLIGERLNLPDGEAGVKSENQAVNNFHCDPVTIKQLKVLKDYYPSSNGKIPVIEALDGQLITNKLMLTPNVAGNEYISDTDNDILKMVVVNRYFKAPVAKSFIRNFGFRKGAIASTVAHDSHNIVAVGADDESLLKAINLVIEARGGISCVSPNPAGFDEKILPLPVAGLMSDGDAYDVAASYTAIDKMAKGLGGNLSAPFMVLSFMALLVIPHLKLSDKGLFDGDSFSFV
jgi:adenine deaminase